jgi:signal transduction histidine kinase
MTSHLNAVGEFQEVPGGRLEGDGARSATPPPSATPISEIIAGLRDVVALQGLSDQEYYWLASHGTERIADGQGIAFRQNEAAHHLNIILKGEIYVHRRNSGTVNLFIGRTAQITGRLPFSRMVRWAGEGCSSDYLWILDIHEDEFPGMLVAIPSMAQRCVSIMLDRVRDFAVADQQAEKLIALGKLAANLSHELNNPASAAQRAALSLASMMDRDEELCRLGRLFGSDKELSRYIEWTRKALGIIANVTVSDDISLAESDREEALVAWLEAHLVPEAWSVAPVLARTGLPIRVLDELAPAISRSSLAAAISSFAASLNARQMVEAVSDSSARIFRLIDAIKDYSYMDQAPIQKVDLTQSLENTLALLHPRLREMTVVRNYDSSVSSITAYGGELSQVWTALIENAIDATLGTGTLKLTTRLKGDMAFVEVWDDGVGIDAALSTRIFEPFFTTKPLGQGLGLGLDTVRRIVSKHFGSVTVQSIPHATCFQVLLPLDRPQIY